MARVQWARRKAKSRVRIPTGEEIRSKIDPLPGQVEFLSWFDDPATKIVVYRGGLGSGKSWIGAHCVLEMAARNPGVRGFIGANTYPQLHQTTLSGLYEVAEAYGIPIHPSKPESAAKKKSLLLWGCVEVICRSAENKGYQTWDGFKVGWFWLDEAKNMDFEAYLTINERLRDGRVDQLKGWLTSTPLGTNWFGEIESDPDVKVITADTRSNHHLPVGYVDSLLAKMDPDLARQQLEGKVLNIYSGECYPRFDPAENVRTLSRLDDVELIVGVDFNVEPGMHAEAMHIVGDDVFVIDEIYIKGGDTPRLAREIVERYGTEGVIVHPDAAGGHRSTTGTSDHKILKDAGLKIRCRPANPPIKDRINSVNGRILNALGERHLFVDPRCKQLVKDLKQCTWEVMQSGSYKGPLTHPGAALGYAVEYKFPVVSRAFGVKLPPVR
ncbi:MAG: terminase family protein [Acidobacteriota bacterium]